MAESTKVQEKRQNLLSSMQTIVSHDNHDDSHHGAATMPMYQSNVFTFNEHEAFEKALQNKLDHTVYTRGNNPTVNFLEERISLLEGGEASRCFSSGMAAISSAILSTVKAGDHVLCVDQVYADTKKFLHEYLSRFGITTTFFEGKDILSLQQALQSNTKLIYLESPTSTFMELQDLERCAEIAKSIGATTIIDNTWATPCFQNPLKLGIDLVVQSLSKYVGGHSDAMGGVVVGSRERLDSIARNEFMLLGGILSPYNANLIMRGLRTLPLRMGIFQRQGLEVAQFLEKQSFITKINHSGLTSHPQHELAEKQMNGYSSLFSFEVNIPMEDMRIWANSLKYFGMGVSWGGYHSLIKLTESHHSQKTVICRMYIGLEDTNELISDIIEAFKKIGQVCK